MINEIKSVIEKHKEHIPVKVTAEILAVMDEAEAKGNVGVFDWLREHISYGRYNTANNVMDEYNNIAIDFALSRVDEAEAKRESDCCEWEGFDNSPIKEAEMWTYKTTCQMYIREEYTDTHWKFCPYCGKPIKIVEVE